jgi:hypothetical protein
VQYEVVGGLELRPDGVARALVEARRVEGSVGREHGARGGVGVARGKFADGLGLAQEVGYESDLLGTKTGVGLADLPFFSTARRHLLPGLYLTIRVFGFSCSTAISVSSSLSSIIFSIAWLVIRCLPQELCVPPRSVH